MSSTAIAFNSSIREISSENQQYSSRAPFRNSVRIESADWIEKKERNGDKDGEGIVKLNGRLPVDDQPPSVIGAWRRDNTHPNHAGPGWICRCTRRLPSRARAICKFLLPPAPRCQTHARPVLCVIHESRVFFLSVSWGSRGFPFFRLLTEIWIVEDL